MVATVTGLHQPPRRDLTGLSHAFITDHVMIAKARDTIILPLLFLLFLDLGIFFIIILKNEHYFQNNFFYLTFHNIIPNLDLSGMAVIECEKNVCVEIGIALPIG